MDQDTLELARLLCCRAGMIMEDVAALAVVPPQEVAVLRNVVADLLAAVQRMQSLLDAADALVAE